VTAICEFMANEASTTIDLDGLAAIVATADVTTLASGRPLSNDRDDRWRVQINTRIEHDL
jgi:hypothetical protein